MDNLSQSSFRSSGSMFQAPRKAFVDGEMLDGEYVTKQIITQSNILIETPEHIKNKVQGDKVVHVRSMKIHDSTIPLADRHKILFMAKAIK